MSSEPSPRIPQIIAHRGASAVAPENTLAAARSAWEMGADTVEVDVRCNANGRVVVIHDADTRRTTGVNLRVANSTLAELQALDAGSFKGERWRDEKIPALSDILAAVPTDKRLVIELKAGLELLDPLEDDLSASSRERAFQLANRIILIAFDRHLLARAKERIPQFPAFWLGDPSRGTGRLRPTAAVRRMIAQARDSGFDGLDLRAHRCLNARLVDEIHAAGLQLFVWTVNAPRVCARLLRAGVDGITTDRPEVMLEVRNAELRTLKEANSP